MTTIVPFGPGGASDLAIRPLNPLLEKELGVTINVEFLPGAGSQIGVTELARAKADGCTIGWTHLPAVNAIYLDPSRGAAFKRESFAPIAMFAIDGGGISVRADSPLNTLPDLIEASKKEPGSVSISDSGIFSDGHFLALELQRQAGIEVAVVHGTGGGQGVADLLGGHISAQAVNLGGATVGLMESKQIKLLAVFTPERSKLYPDVPTAESYGYPISSSTNRALSAPAGTPKAIIDEISAAFAKVVNGPEIQGRGAAAIAGSDKVVLSPHIGSSTHETQAAMGFSMLESLRSHFASSPVRPTAGVRTS